MLVMVLLALCATLIALISVLFLVLYVALYRAPSTTSKASLGRSAAVVVLGDIGRSPRMCFHVESLANEGWKVAVVGYKGTLPPPPLRRPSIKHHHLRNPPAFVGRLPRFAFALVAPIKVAFQSLSLFWELAAVVQPPPEIVLVQTPPALPTLFVVRLVCALLGSRVIIDWHNLGYTILALRMGEKSPLVRLAETLERITGQSAFAHLFVTSAMMKHLDRHWKLKGRKAVLHDRPPSHFRRSTTDEVHELFTRLAPQIRPPLDDFYPQYTLPASTPFTSLSAEGRPLPRSEGLRPDSPAPTSSLGHSDHVGTGSGAYLREDRPALVVSSTSWTADEDFALLLHAARIYERRAKELAERRASSSRPASVFGGDGSLQSSPVRTHVRSRNGDSSGSASSRGSDGVHGLTLDTDATRTSKERRRPSLGALRSATLPNEPAAWLPKMLVVVTGKGELKAQYEAEIARLERDERWEWVRIRTAWLESDDYPTLLGAADVGVSLHSSSSGLDLPMKVVDMLGCGLPVCALDFNCLDELVHDGHNGLVFRDAEGLARQLESLLALHPSLNWLLSGAGMQSPFEPPVTSSAATSPRLPGSSSWPSNSQWTTTAPPSPHTSFTLLHSPGLSASAASGWPRVAQRSRTSTWEGNWKTVVRPILAAADAEREEQRSRKAKPGRGRGRGRSGGVDASTSGEGESLLSGRGELLADEWDETVDGGGAMPSARGGEEPQRPIEAEGVVHGQETLRSASMRLRQRYSVHSTSQPSASMDGDDGPLQQQQQSADRRGGKRGSTIPDIHVSLAGHSDS